MILQKQFSSKTIFIQKSAPQNWSKHKSIRKRIWTKIILFWYLWAAILKTIVIFEISTLEFFKTQSFIRNKKNINSDQKHLIWIFLSCHLRKGRISRQDYLIFQNSKFRAKQKSPKKKSGIWTFKFVERESFAEK